MKAKRRSGHKTHHGTRLFECAQAEGEFFTRWRWSEPLNQRFVDALLVARIREGRDG
jgi:hypothetical protein